MSYLRVLSILILFSANTYAQTSKDLEECFIQIFNIEEIDSIIQTYEYSISNVKIEKGSIFILKDRIDEIFTNNTDINSNDLSFDELNKQNLRTIAIRDQIDLLSDIINKHLYFYIIELTANFGVFEFWTGLFFSKRAEGTILLLARIELSKENGVWQIVSKTIDTEIYSIGKSYEKKVPKWPFTTLY